MKKVLAVMAGLVFGCCGCSTIVGTRAADGALTITSHRFFWTSEGIEFSLADTNRLVTTLKVQKSSTDSTAVAAVFSGLQSLGVSTVK